MLDTLKDYLIFYFFFSSASLKKIKQNKKIE